MPRTVKVAAIQMDVTPTSTGKRLKRADELVKQAALAGAQLVVLPELFNTGYIYSDTNFQNAEPIYGPTATWLKNTAQLRQIHLSKNIILALLSARKYPF
ncbi:carbon-nitrogen hydrolase family protein [Anaerolineales bacterium HSG6]|nr:carbon-nitrogen hydrolase family protein [Anaerolineales bacterium HSG6]MDM8532319.1 carbon-nitrogen hydrolase family protein [Anaerolineales bacterium HSG25]